MAQGNIEHFEGALEYCCQSSSDGAHRHAARDRRSIFNGQVEWLRRAASANDAISCGTEAKQPDCDHRRYSLELGDGLESGLEERESARGRNRICRHIDLLGGRWKRRPSGNRSVLSGKPTFKDV